MIKLPILTTSPIHFSLRGSENAHFERRSERVTINKLWFDFRYTNWREGQPDDYDGNENCVHLYLSDHVSQWNDMPCVLDNPAEAAFACQKVAKRGG